MKTASKYFYILLLLSSHLVMAQQCTFEQIYPYKASIYDLIYKTINNDFICLTNDCVDTSANNSCAGGSFVNRLLRIDSCGMVIWDKRINLTYGSIFYDGICETDSEDIMLVGTYGGFLSGLFIIKLSKVGEIVYEKRFLNTPTGTTIYFYSNNSIIKLSNKNFLVSGNRSRYEGQPSVPFILEIDEIGNIIRYQEFTHTFKVNQIYASQFVKSIDDTSYFFTLEAGYEHYDTTYIYMPDTTYISVTKNDYRDIVFAFLDTALNITDWYSITSLVGDSIRPHIDRHSSTRLVNDTVVYIAGELFKDHKTPPPTNRPLNAAALLSVRERKVISRELYGIDDPIPYPLFFRKDMLSIYNNASDSSFIIKDKNFNTIKTIKTTSPQKFTVYPETPSFPTRNSLVTAYLTENFSIIAMGTSIYRKIKTADSDSLLNPYARETYIIKIDSNGNFTPTTWNSLPEYNTKQKPLLIYPNPASSNLTIELPDGLYNIEVFDSKGTLVMKRSDIDTKTDLNTQFLREGLYWIKANHQLSEASYNRKFVIKR